MDQPVRQVNALQKYSGKNLKLMELNGASEQVYLATSVSHCLSRMDMLMLGISKIGMANGFHVYSMVTLKMLVIESEI